MKKSIKIIIIIFLLIPIAYFGIYLIQIYSLKRSFSIEQSQIFDESSDFISCNYNILSPKLAFVFRTGFGGMIGFYEPQKLFYETEVEWDSDDIGGTNVKNTTYPELLKMIKKDCSRFQKSGSVSLNPDEMTWVYSPAPTKEKIERDKVEKIEGIKSEISELSSEKRQELADKYNYNPDFTDDELYNWAEEVDLSDFDPEG